MMFKRWIACLVALLMIVPAAGGCGQVPFPWAGKTIETLSIFVKQSPDDPPPPGGWALKPGLAQNDQAVAVNPDAKIYLGVLFGNRVKEDIHISRITFFNMDTGLEEEMEIPPDDAGPFEAARAYLLGFGDSWEVPDTEGEYELRIYVGDEVAASARLTVSGQVPVSMMLLMLDNPPPQVTFFPVQKDVPNAVMQALLQGELTLDNGCLCVAGNLILWPYGYTVQTEGDEIRVLNAEGRAVARVGDFVRLGGGEIPAASAEKRTGMALPEGCLGPYWLTGEVVEEEVKNGTGSEKYADVIEEYKDTPELIEAAIYARHHGITVEEALRRFSVQDEFRGLEATLIELEPQTFAGLWIEHVPHRVVVAFTRDGEETIKKYVSENQTMYITVRTVKYSYAELLAVQKEFGAALRDLGVPADSAGHVQENRVEFRVTDRAPIDEAVQSGRLTIPGCVDVVTVEGLATFE